MNRRQDGTRAQPEQCISGSPPFRERVWGQGSTGPLPPASRDSRHRTAPAESDHASPLHCVELESGGFIPVREDLSTERRVRRTYCGVTSWCAIANSASSSRVETPVLSK